MKTNRNGSISSPRGVFLKEEACGHGMSSLLAFSLPVLLFFCGPLFAAEPTPEEVQAKQRLLELMNMDVTTVSRVSESLDETPGSVYVYTRETIQKRGYRSLGELLQTVPGFTVFHRDLGYVAGVRGLNANDNEKITLLINGQNLNGVSEMDFLNGPINLDNVERVEVVVGPSSFFQPANTLAATVNVITKVLDGSEVVLATGNSLPYSATLMSGKKWDPDKFLSFSFSTAEKRGFHAWLDQPPRGRSYLNERTGELDFPSFFSVLNGQLGEWSAQATAHRMVTPELNIDELAAGNNGIMVDEFYSVLVKNEHAWTRDFVSVASLAATAKNKTRLEDGSSTSNGIEIAAAQCDYTTDLGLRYTGFADHLVQAGVQAGYVHNFDTYTIVSYQPSLVIPKTTLVGADSQSVGVYVDDEYRATKWLKLVAGVRADHNNVLRNDEWYPGARAAIIVEPASNWVSKLIYNRAARMPTALESPMNEGWGMGKPNTPSFATNPNASQPEILSTYEWQNIVYLGQVRLGATVYHQEIKDFISWFNPWTNIGDFSGNGVELNMQAQLNQAITLWANGSWNDSKLHPVESGPSTGVFPVDSQGRITGAPEYTANAGFDFEIMKNLTFSPSLRYFTGQAGSDGGVPVTIRNRAYLDATLLWRDCWKTSRGTTMDVRLSGHNLADNREQVASQWHRKLYEPRGAEVVLEAYLRF